MGVDASNCKSWYIAAAGRTAVLCRRRWVSFDVFPFHFCLYLLLFLATTRTCFSIIIVMPSGAVLEGSPPPLRPRALAYLVSRDSELAYLLRSLVKLSPPPPPHTTTTSTSVQIVLLRLVSDILARFSGSNRARRVVYRLTAQASQAYRQRDESHGR